MKLTNDLVEKMRLGFGAGLEANGMFENLKQDWLTLSAKIEKLTAERDSLKAHLEKAMEALVKIAGAEDLGDEPHPWFTIAKEALSSQVAASIGKEKE